MAEIVQNSKDEVSHWVSSIIVNWSSSDGPGSDIESEEIFESMNQKKESEKLL